MVQRGSDKAKKESLNLIKVILMKGEWEKHENEGFSWEIEGQKMRLALEKGKNGEKGLATVLFLENQQDSERGIGTVVKIWTEERHEAFKSLQEPTLFSNKICSLKAQKVLATFFYNKYYRWLTVAPLGDGAFLKASRTSDLHSLGG